MALALVLPARGAHPDAVVAADGSGQFRSVQAAVDAAPTNSQGRFVIRIQPGVYKERIVVPPEHRRVSFIGENAATTVLTFNLGAGNPGDNEEGGGPFQTPSVLIQADDFLAENITFENSFGSGTQAVAVAVSGDRAVFRKCRFLGWQNTLLSQIGREYFENCYIAGQTDFIFGSATAYFDNCQIHCMTNGCITAASTPQQQPFGFVFNHCRITGEMPEVRTFLGRPWRPYACVAFLNTDMGDVVRQEGWDNGRDPAVEKTARFCEFNSTGEGADSQVRAPWAYELSAREAKTFSLEQVLGGLDEWTPKSGKVHSPISVEKADAISKTAGVPPASSGNEAYLFVSFRGNGLNGIVLAGSLDGYHWTNINRPSFKPDVGNQKILRDPSLLRGPDGTFHLVWTAGWRTEEGFGYASSPDLIHWSEQRLIPVKAAELAMRNVWAPELFYDAAAKQFLILWASSVEGAFPDYLEKKGSNYRLYYMTTADFASFSPAKLFFDAGYSAIDGFIVQDGKRFVLVHKDNSRPYLGIRMAFADRLPGPWGPASSVLTQRGCEGPSALKVGEEWMVYFDAYRDGTYGALRTRDFRHFTDVSSLVSFPKGHKHGTPLTVPRSFLEALLARP